MPRHSNQPLLVRSLQQVTRRLVRRPWAAVCAAAVLAAAGVALALAALEFKTNRLDLLNPSSVFNQRWTAYLDEFGDDDDAVLIASGPPHRVTEALDAIAGTLAEAALPPEDVLARPDFSRVEAAGLHLLDPAQLSDLQRRLEALPQSPAQWRQLGVTSMLGRAVGRLEAAGDEQPARRTEELISAMLAWLRQEDYVSVWESAAPASLLASRTPQHLLSDDGQLGFVMVRVPRRRGVPSAERIALIRRAQRAARDAHPGLQIGLTGIPILEYDEMQSSQQDMGKSTALSLAGVAVLFAAGFGGLRLPLLAVLNLVVSLCWCLGYITLAVGHLNILSVAFGAILVGLGIDFGIHLVAAYTRIRPTAASSQQAVVDSVGQVGPGIVTGGLTSALAFTTAVLTDFKGVAELGLIAGGGMLLCMASSLLVLPSLMQLAEARRPPSELAPPLPSSAIAWLPRAAPRTTLLLVLGATAALAVALPRLSYDHNLLNLQPQQSESVRWERQLVERSGHGSWYALSLCRDMDQLRRRREALLQLASVERTESLEPLTPRDQDQRAAALEQISRWCSRLPAEAAGPAVDGRQLAELERLLGRAEQLASGTHSELAAVAAAAQNQLSRTAADEAAAQLTQLNRRLAGDLLGRLRRLADAAAAEPPRLDDLPPELTSRYRGRTGQHLLKVYARGGARDFQQLEAFVRDVERIDPNCTGHPVQTFYASQQMQRSFLHAAVYSLLAVAAVLMLDFRSVRLSLLAMTPMALGLLQLMGLLAALQIPLNPANMIVLPLILGIGIDDGVHVVHDYLRQSGRYRLGDTTATAVLVTSATTMVGFGSMMASRHQGLRSLGQVLTLGVFCCLATSLIALPAILSWATRSRPP